MYRGPVWPQNLNAFWPQNTSQHRILLGIRKPNNDNSELFLRSHVKGSRDWSELASKGNSKTTENQGNHLEPNLKF